MRTPQLLQSAPPSEAVFSRATYASVKAGAPLENGIYAGLSLHAEQPVALVLLPGELDSAKWSDGVAWAEKQGGMLPSRIDQLVLFKNLKGEFKEAYYWSCEEYAPNPDYAWNQNFTNGNQNYNHKDNSYRARAVRSSIRCRSPPP